MRSHVNRFAFTLLELLLSIGIALVVLAMVLPACFTVLQRVREYETCAEIQHLDDACEAFHLKYGCYPPSHVVLREKGGYRKAGRYETGDFHFIGHNGVQVEETFKIEEDEDATLRMVFKGIDANLYQTSGGKEWHDWNGNGELDEEYSLCGLQVLVFFLGGIPEYDTSTGRSRLTGFCGDRTHPARKTDGGTRTGPFFEFDSTRLILKRPDQVSKAILPHPGYLDPFGSPYAYFRAIRYRNVESYIISVNPFGAFSSTIEPDDVTTPHAASPRYSGIEGELIYFNNGRFQVKDVVWFQPKRFQIISAGYNRRFGAGEWPPVNPHERDDYIRWGRDDLTNFCEGRMERLLK